MSGPTLPRTAVFGFALPFDGNHRRTVFVIADDGSLWQTCYHQGQWTAWASFPPLPPIEVQAPVEVMK